VAIGEHLAARYAESTDYVTEVNHRDIEKGP
jgi:hypothetical protein